MKKQLSPRKVIPLVLAIAALVAIGLVGHALPPHGEGKWVQSGVDDCGPNHICVKWDIQGAPAEDQCCIPPGNLYDEDFSACMTHLRHDLH